MSDWQSNRKSSNIWFKLESEIALQQSYWTQTHWCSFIKVVAKGLLLRPNDGRNSFPGQGWSRVKLSHEWYREPNGSPYWDTTSQVVCRVQSIDWYCEASTSSKWYKFHLPSRTATSFTIRFLSSSLLRVTYNRYVRFSGDLQVISGNCGVVASKQFSRCIINSGHAVVRCSFMHTAGNIPSQC